MRGVGLVLWCGGDSVRGMGLVVLCWDEGCGI